MELREISMFEARQNDLPASEPGVGEVCTWYALTDEGLNKGYMETTRYEEDDVTEISFFMIPDIYQGYGLGKAVLTLYLDSYIPLATPNKLLTTFFEYNGEYGEALASIFSSHGFDISLNPFRECTIPLDTVRERLATGKNPSYKGRMVNLTEGINDVLAAVGQDIDSDITVTDVKESELELSVAAFDNDDRMEALMLMTEDPETGDAVVTDLYSDSKDPTLLMKFFGFAAENALNAVEPPVNISFAAANERLEEIMETVFEDPRTSEIIMAEGEFNLGKYVELLKLGKNREAR